MLTKKQLELLLYIRDRIEETGVSPSFDEMKDALDLKSKSGIHRLITALEERGFIRRLPNRARALEVLKTPDGVPDLSANNKSAPNPPGQKPVGGFKPEIVEGGRRRPANTSVAPPPALDGVTELPVLGRIAAGTPIEAIQHEVDRLAAPTAFLGAGEHYILEVQGESMIEAGIHDGDFAIIKKTDKMPDAQGAAGDIVVALVDEEEATLKRIRKKGGTIALEAANPEFETRLFPADRVRVQGKLVGLMRRY